MVREFGGRGGKGCEGGVLLTWVLARCIGWYGRWLLWWGWDCVCCRGYGGVECHRMLVVW